MKLLATTAISVLVSTASGASLATEPAPMGVWMRGDGNAKVRMASCGSDICATNLWIKDTSSGEEVGDKLILKVKQEDSTLLVGTAYDPKRSLTYSMEMKVMSNRMTTRGCIIGGLICKEVSWSRVE